MTQITITVTYDFGFITNVYLGNDPAKALQVARRFAGIPAVVAIKVA